MTEVDDAKHKEMWAAVEADEMGNLPYGDDGDVSVKRSPTTGNQQQQQSARRPVVYMPFQHAGYQR